MSGADHGHGAFCSGDSSSGVFCQESQTTGMDIPGSLLWSALSRRTLLNVLTLGLPFSPGLHLLLPRVTSRSLASLPLAPLVSAPPVLAFLGLLSILRRPSSSEPAHQSALHPPPAGLALPVFLGFSQYPAPHRPSTYPSLPSSHLHPLPSPPYLRRFSSSLVFRFVRGPISFFGRLAVLASSIPTKNRFPIYKYLYVLPLFRLFLPGSLARRTRPYLCRRSFSRTTPAFLSHVHFRTAPQLQSIAPQWINPASMLFVFLILAPLGWPVHHPDLYHSGER
ncbi:hypothetical protein C8R45DRAFT_1115136 [Mycena sanguinolenta]|nr:hypothetical protein C8R45DRAFT_1115136 [Mycena sanguinolenta]